MISKELLSEVLEFNVIDFIPDRKMFTILRVDENGKHQCYWNTYELAHKCKEWALKSSYQLHSAMRNGNLPIVVLIDEQDVLRHYFKADTEPEVIFKACEWLLENKKS